MFNICRDCAFTWVLESYLHLEASFCTLYPVSNAFLKTSQRSKSLLQENWALTTIRCIIIIITACILVPQLTLLSKLILPAWYEQIQVGKKQLKLVICDGDIMKQNGSKVNNDITGFKSFNYFKMSMLQTDESIWYMKHNI